ncbi:MAG TPA: primosomal protein N' [Candidatus Polarisedimenticolaceae bacterium]|nr:primosomal protein N' [Candidatus Polarisedimenticolaceae bacterium]
MTLAEVAVPVPLRRLFTYRVPEALRDRVAVGVRVRVPLGRRSVLGTVVAWPGAAVAEGIDVKDVADVPAEAPALPPDLLALTKFVADYYLCSWGEAIEAALPPEPPRTKRGIAADPVPIAAGEVPAHDPTAAQRAALDVLVPAIVARAFAPFLLWGATGSGKTEVYLRAAEAALAEGRGVLYLVPEIGLTPLLVTRLEARFPGQVAVLHSALPPRVRREAWEAVRAGTKRFVVGARSAVFAPLADPGLIVIDEEHDPSYKQEDAPRYNGRDVAVVRARLARAAIVLGSATPSLESFHHARTGRYALLALGGRVEARPLPEVRLVDMREAFRGAGAVLPVAPALAEALRACLARGEQALVLRNRRGWSAAILCPACGQRITCTRCSVALTWHKSARRLRCHGCGRESARPDACPACGSDALREWGEGTERIEDEIKAAVPGARVARMDRDTVRGRGGHEKILRRFEAGEIDVLVGTQMIAKGHDFPRVTLVGILAADHALGLPDFRAGERAFQLLTQVAGRAGRGERPGEVIAQAFDPGHPVLRHAASQDYLAFYDAEMRYRRAMRYPPLAALVQIMVSHRDLSQAWRIAGEVAQALEAAAADGPLTVLGPGPAPIERLRGLYRMQILVRSAGRRRLVEAVASALAPFEATALRRSIHVDVDPVSLL